MAKVKTIFREPAELRREPTPMTENEQCAATGQRSYKGATVTVWLADEKATEKAAK